MLCLGTTSSFLFQVPLGGLSLSSPAKEKIAGGVARFLRASLGHNRPAVDTQNIPLLRKGRVLAKRVIVAGAAAWSLTELSALRRELPRLPSPLVLGPVRYRRQLQDTLKSQV